MTIWWPTIIICFALPMSACYATIPWFRAAVNRRLTFKPFDYDALTQIFERGLPERLTIECLQATYKGNTPEHLFVDIYPHKENVAAVRFRVDEDFPIARIFHNALVGNYSALCIRSKKPPVLSINQSVYRVIEYEYDSQYLLIYLKHE